jgi:hypothetical protein
MRALEVLVNGNRVETVGVRGAGIATVIMDCNTDPRKPGRASLAVQVWLSVALMVRRTIILNGQRYRWVLTQRFSFDSLM